ncbi:MULTISPECIES: nucleotidyltransferase domain-containing protein [unclassified Thiocapsa]|uniref:nucleotidyltransferase domain-containing protein n=1 Tax=unclassified Thiocapsa TaxID=2641286 RepID=UPI0035B46FBB
MPPNPVTQALQQSLAQRLGPHLRGIWLFGSRARGDARETSDYDVLILVDENTQAIRDSILDVQVDILDHHDALVATIVRTEDEWQRSQGYPLAKNIAREAVRL